MGIRVLDSEELFHQALALPALDRPGFLDDACGEQAQLRQRLERLLRAHSQSGKFLEEPLLARPQQVDPEEAIGTSIGPYELQAVLGEGGFGVVYRARQSGPLPRDVALKVIKLGMDTRRVIARFEIERQALGKTDHPFISTVLDAGATPEGRPYFVMEFIDGVDLCTYGVNKGLTIPERLRLFVDVCRGVQHAHQKGLIHRDLKPSNVLVVEKDSVPSPRLIDFGVAKAIHTRAAVGTAHTEIGQIIGTPAYMSPEQAGSTQSDVDTRSDIYSLGAMLYEMLTGSPPFDALRLREAPLLDLQAILRDEDPPRPSDRAQEAHQNEGPRHSSSRRSTDRALAAALRGDLDCIVMKAMEKDRSRRYSSAEALAADIQRHLEHEPVLASPPSTTYRLQKFVQRNQLKVLATSAVILALLTGGGLSLWGWREAVHQRNQSDARSRFVEALMAGSIPAQDLQLRARSTFGADHSAYAAALQLGAEQARARGDLEAAIGLQDQALRTWIALHGNEHLAVADAHGRLGAILQDNGAIDEAQEHLEQALALAARASDAVPASMLEVHVHLAAIHRRRGRLLEAATQLETVIAIRRAEFPHQQHALGLVLDQLSAVLTTAGKHEEALIAGSEAIQAFQKAFPGETLATADRQISFGVWLSGSWFRARPQLTQAESNLRAGLSFYDQNPRLKGRSYATGLLALAGLLEARSASDPEVLTLLENALESTQRLHGSESVEYARVELRVADFCRANGQEERAAQLGRHAFEIRAAELSKDFTPSSSLLAVGNWVNGMAQQRDATEDTYTLFVELVELMILHAPEREDLQELRTRLVASRDAAASKGPSDRP